LQWTTKTYGDGKIATITLGVCDRNPKISRIFIIFFLNLCGSKPAMRQGIGYANYYNTISILKPDIVNNQINVFQRQPPKKCFFANVSMIRLLIFL